MCGRPKTRMHEPLKQTTGDPHAWAPRRLEACSGPRSCEWPLPTVSVVSDCLQSDRCPVTKRKPEWEARPQRARLCDAASAVVTKSVWCTCMLHLQLYAAPANIVCPRRFPQGRYIRFLCFEGNGCGWELLIYTFKIERKSSTHAHAHACTKTAKCRVWELRKRTPRPPGNDPRLHFHESGM